MTVTVGLLAFPGFDLLDLVGPYEALLTADRLAGRRGEPPRFELLTLGTDDHPTTAYGGLRVLPTVPARDVDHLDVLVVPGTIDVARALADGTILGAVRHLAERADTVTSVCTGSFLLAAVGLLEGRPATTHHEDVPNLAARPDVGAATAGVRWVDDGDVVTGGGIASAIAFGLHLVDRFAGRELALATARQLEYAWDPSGADGVE